MWEVDDTNESTNNISMRFKSYAKLSAHKALIDPRTGREQLNLYHLTLVVSFPFYRTHNIQSLLFTINLN